MDTLQISFFGPFLYRFKATQVEVYAPKCPGHTAGIFCTKNEAPLPGQHRHGDTLAYRVQGPVFTPPAPLPYPKIYDPAKSILDVSSVIQPALDKASFCVIVPTPQTVTPMNPTLVQVIDESTATPTTSYLKRATGLRFFYDADLTKAMTLSVDNSSAPAQNFGFEAPNLGFNFDDAYVRYASATPEDPDHEDAMHCFDLIAELAGVNWWVNYQDPQKAPGTQGFFRSGNDCRAPILMAK